MPQIITNIEERLLTNISYRGGCWEWQRALDRDGYGATSRNGKIRRAHRVSYEVFVGTIPDGLQLDHLCRNRKCINPAHLEPVTFAENRRRARKKVSDVCRSGHVFSVLGSYRSSDRQGTKCRECNKLHQAKYRAKLKEKV